MAFVVVGYMVMTQEKDSKGVLKRDKPLSKQYSCRSAADLFCEMAKKDNPTAVVREVMKHDDIGE